MIAGLAVMVRSLTVQGAEPKTGPDTQASEKTYPTGLWRSEPPPDCPFKASESFSGVEFSGRNANYTGADTWYPSWAADGNMYSTWTDGKTDGMVPRGKTRPVYTEIPPLMKSGLFGPVRMITPTN
jgi:hypothetical protein